jgi:hypothetical protein
MEGAGEERPKMSSSDPLIGIALHFEYKGGKRSLR